MPDPKRRSPTFAVMAAQARMSASRSDPWEVAYYRRPGEPEPRLAVPAKTYLWSECPTPVASHFATVVVEVAKAPPPKFAGGGYWEAMHGNMAGFHEVRKKYRGMHYRLFCRLDTESVGTPPLLTLLCGLTKPDGTVFSEADYAWVRELGAEYLGTNPRSVVF